MKENTTKESEYLIYDIRSFTIIVEENLFSKIPNLLTLGTVKTYWLIYTFKNLEQKRFYITLSKRTMIYVFILLVLLKPNAKKS